MFITRNNSFSYLPLSANHLMCVFLTFIPRGTVGDRGYKCCAFPHKVGHLITLCSTDLALSVRVCSTLEWTGGQL